MAVNVLGEAIGNGVPLVVLAPHLDDAALSCGALMADALRRTSVTVVTLFTEASDGPYTLSARRYLRQIGAQGAQFLYAQRRAEDRAALESIGAGWVHAGLTEALFRCRANPGQRSRWVRILPELGHVYPVYRRHITGGRVAAADAAAVGAVSDVIRGLNAGGSGILLAPLGVGGHVDHVVVRNAAERSGARVVYYSDFPYNLRSPADRGFIQRNGLTGIQYPDSGASVAKTALVRAYRTQLHALFRDGHIPPAPELFFAPAEGAAPSGRPGNFAKVRAQVDD